ncbi:MAG TPA: type VI secretion system contractile sheath large subunit [Thermoanaerobaculia bacterium]|nr:type VI secretion system contractile sheath large subunit [Thermoanaerobaculia bacterium]
MSNAPERGKAEAIVREQTGEVDLLSKILEEGRMVQHAGQAQGARDMIAEFVQQAMQGQMVMSRNLETSLQARIAEIDRLLSAQLNEIMHAEPYQRLEASWRGLHHLVFESETGTMLKIRVLNVSKKDLLKDLERAAEFDQSAVFKKVYEEEYGTFGGQPFGALIGDYYFSNHPQDQLLLEKMAQVAAAANAPFIAAPAPQLFGWESFQEMTEVRDLAKIFDRTEYAKWRSFRDSEDSRYVGMAMPRTLMRLPYGKETVPTETFNFEEDVDGKDHNKYLWGNAAYSFGTRLTEAFALYGWCVAIRGVEGGGLVQGLPVHTFQTDEGDVALKCPTEIAITDRREKELSDLGFLPLVHCKNTDYAAFFGGQSCQKAKKYDTDSANSNARLSTMLPHIFAVSRFAHYLKAMMRDKVGSFMTRKDCEYFLNQWIAGYITTDDTASQATRAQYPLREAKIEVAEIPGKPGAYRAVAFLRPHFQLDELQVSLRLVADLPSSARK